MNKEEIIKIEIERLEHIRCDHCASFNTRLVPIGISYRYEKDISKLQKIPGFIDPPFIGDIMAFATDIFKDCLDCTHRERIQPQYIKYFRDNWKGLDDDDKEAMRSKNRITREQLYVMVDKLEKKNEKLIKEEMIDKIDPKENSKPKEEVIADETEKTIEPGDTGRN